MKSVIEQAESSTDVATILHMELETILQHYNKGLEVWRDFLRDTIGFKQSTVDKALEAAPGRAAQQLGGSGDGQPSIQSIMKSRSARDTRLENMCAAVLC